MSVDSKIKMGGNKITGLSSDTLLDTTDAVSYAALEHHVINKKISKKGDEIIGNLDFKIGSDVNRRVGCLDMSALGNTFNLLLGNTNYISHEKSQPLIMYTDKGFLVKINGSDIIRFGNDSSNKHVKSYQNIISNLEPIKPTHAATKFYVDTLRCILGYVPTLKSNNTKSGFTVTASDVYGSNQPYHVFDDNSSLQWLVANTVPNYWMKIELPESIYIWRFDLTGATEYMTDWELLGSEDGSEWSVWSTIHRESAYGVDDSKVHSFGVSPSNSFKFYMIRVYGSIGVNPRLKYWQLYTYSI